MAGTAPYFDQVMLPGSGGIVVPSEVFGSKGAGTPGGIMALWRETDFDVTAVNTARGVNNSVALLAPEYASSLITFNNSSSNNVNFTLAAVPPGKVYILENRSGNSVTFLVAGKNGVTLGNNNRQIVVASSLAGDIIAAAAAIQGS